MAYRNRSHLVAHICHGWHAVLPVRSSKIHRRDPIRLIFTKQLVCSQRSSLSRNVVVAQATEQLQKSSGVEDVDFTYNIDSLSSLADKLLGGKEAPTAEQVADGVNSSLQHGLSDSHARFSERKLAFGTNRLPSRKEV